MNRLGRLKEEEGNRRKGWLGRNGDHGVAGEFVGEGGVGFCEVIEVVVGEDCH